MNTTWILSLAPFAALPLLVPQAGPAAPRKLERISPAQGAPTHVPGEEVSFPDWKKRLSDSDLGRRESAYAELLDQARGDKDLRGQLERWAGAVDAPDLAWTARLALRELRSAGPGRARGPQARSGGDYDDLRQRFDDLERNFGGMDSMFEDLRARLDNDLQPYFVLPGPDVPFGRPPQGAPPGSSQQLQSYSLQVGPDGVTLDTTESIDGNSQRRTYKAKSMDELLQQNPQLRGKIGGGSGGGAFRLDLPGTPGMRLGTPREDGLPDARPTQQPPTDVLGIYSQKLTPDQAKDLELEPEQGLRVERIEPGTIAQILGIRRGDTLVELNGKPVYSVDDVRKVLKERKADEDLSVTLIGEGSHERRTLRWSPAVPQPGPEKPRKL